MNVSLFEQAVEVAQESNKLLRDVMQFGARKTDPETSKRSASDSENLIRWGTHRTRLLETYYQADPTAPPLQLTDEESAVMARLTPPSSSSPWKRSSELRDSGFIEDTGERRRSSYGAEVMVCQITESGKSAYENAVRYNREA